MFQSHSNSFQPHPWLSPCRFWPTPHRFWPSSLTALTQAPKRPSPGLSVGSPCLFSFYKYPCKILASTHAPNFGINIILFWNSCKSWWFLNVSQLQTVPRAPRHQWIFSNYAVSLLDLRTIPGSNFIKPTLTHALLLHLAISFRLPC